MKILESIAAVLQQWYGLPPTPIAPFLISASDFSAHCAAQPSVHPASRETLLITPCPDDTIEIGLYIAPEIVAHLDADNPAAQLHDGNLDDACVAIEGVSHWLCACAKIENDVPCSLLELELQAEIDKYLVCTDWLRRQGQSARHLLARLFEHYALHGGMSAPDAERYHAASHFAERFCLVAEHQFQRRHRIPHLIDHARHFFHLSHWQKLRRLAQPT